MPPVTKEEKGAKNRRYYKKNKEKIRKRQADNYLKRKSKKAAASTGTEDATPQEAPTVESRRGVCHALLPPAMKSSVDFVVFLFNTNNEQFKNKVLSKTVQVGKEWRKRVIGEVWCCPPGSRRVRTLLNQFPTTGGRRWNIFAFRSSYSDPFHLCGYGCHSYNKNARRDDGRPQSFSLYNNQSGEDKKIFYELEEKEEDDALEEYEQLLTENRKLPRDKRDHDKLVFIKMCYPQVTYVSDLDFSVVVACSDRAFRKDEPVPKIFATRLEAPSLDPAP